jgi:inosine-uridine nucleoside N-ribohydrolase
MRNILHLKSALLALLALGVIALHPPTASAADSPRIPVVLDSDIGDDIDDTWALAMLLKSPEFDLKLVTTTCGKSEYRAKIVAKLLTVAGRTDVAVGQGAGGTTGTGGQQAWVADYKLDGYAGKVHKDGVGALIQLINDSANKTPITIIAIGPLHTVAAALERDPSIAGKANFVGMHGSVRKGYDNNAKPAVEYNMTNVPASKKVFTAAWRSMAITPLDTCGLVRLSGDRFAKLKESNDEVVKAVLENYRIWSKKNQLSELKGSSILFDTAAVYLAGSSKPLMKLEDLNISVGDKGMTLIDPAGAKMAVATSWTDLDGYHDYLVTRLTMPVAKP